MAYFVAILTLDSTRSCVMHSTFPTKGTRSIISTVSISLEGFLASILLLRVIIVAAVIVTVIRVVVVVAVVGVVIVVAIIGVVRIIGIVVVGGGVPFIIKLSFVIIAVTSPSMLWGSPPMYASISFSVFGTMFGHKMANSWNLLILFNSVQAILLACSIPMGWAYAFHQDKASSVKVPVANATLFSSAQLLRENADSVRSNERMRISLGPVFLLGLSAFAMASACASRGAVTPSVISCQMAASVIVGAADFDKILDDKPGHNHGGYPGTEVDLTSDEDPTDEDGGTGMGDSTGVSMSLGDEISLGGKKSRKSNIGGGTIAGRAIITWGGGMASYACMTFIYGSS
ncbi:hypothetical protein Tco_0309299 [Tanacetum coccineum]